VIDIDIHFTAELWAYKSSGAWYFVTLPANDAEKIKFFREKHDGFGTIPVKARINQTEWKTSLFPDKESNSFLLPIKAEVRKKERLMDGDSISISIFMDLQE
jgi:hypothetical protein